jgi:hypothetical protein
MEGVLVYGVGEEKASEGMKCSERVRLMKYYLSCTGEDRQGLLPNWRRKDAAGPLKSLFRLFSGLPLQLRAIFIGDID